MGLLDIGANTALRAFRPSVETVRDAATKHKEPPKVHNMEALKALQLLTQDPRYKIQIPQDMQVKVQKLLNSVAPTGEVYPYHEGLAGEDFGAFLKQKFVPFQDPSMFAPGQRTIYGDIFERSGAGVREAIRELRKPETLEASKAGEFLGRDINIGLPHAIRAFKRGFAQPESVERFQTETIDQLYSSPFMQKQFADYTRPAYLDSPGVQALPRPLQSLLETFDVVRQKPLETLLSGTIASAKGLGKDIITNPADLALIMAPTPKWMQRAGQIPVNKGKAAFKAGVKQVFKPTAPTTKAGVTAAEQAIRANIGKKAGEQLEFPFTKDLPKLKAPTTAAPAAAPGAAERAIEGVGQKVFPFAKVKKKPVIAKPKFKAGDVVKLKEKPIKLSPAQAAKVKAVRAKIKASKADPAHKAILLKELDKIEGKVAKVKPFKKKIVAQKPSQRAKIAPEVIKHQGVDIEIKPAGNVWELNFQGKKLKMREKQSAIARAKQLVDEALPPVKKKVSPLKPVKKKGLTEIQKKSAAAKAKRLLKDKKGQARFESMSRRELETKLKAAERAGNKLMADTYRQALRNKGKVQPFESLGKKLRDQRNKGKVQPFESLGKKLRDQRTKGKVQPFKSLGKKLRDQIGQAKWEDLTPEQQQAIVKSGMSIEKIDKLFGLKEAGKKAAPKIFQKKPRAPRPSKTLGSVAKEVDTGNWGYIRKVATDAQGNKVYTVSGGTFGDTTYTFTRDKINILYGKTAAQLKPPTELPAKAAPTAAAPQVTAKSALRTKHQALQKEIIALQAKKPKGKDLAHLNDLKQQYSQLGKQLTLSDAERRAAIEAGKKAQPRLDKMEGYETFKKPIEKLRDETGTWRPFGKGKQPSKKADQAADDMVAAFRKVLPDIIDDVKQHGGTVMDRIKAMTDDSGKPLANEAVIKMVEKEVAESAAAAKVEITRHGNWNLKNLNQKLRDAIVEMAEKDPAMTKKGPVISDPDVAKIAENLSDTPIMRAILKKKPGQFAGEMRKSIDDAASSLKAVLEEDFGAQGLMKHINAVVKKRFQQQKEFASRTGRALRQNLTANDEAKIKGLIEAVIAKYKRDPLLSPEDFKTIEQGLLKLKHDILNTSNISEFMDKSYFVWLNSLLSNPFTHGVNFTSNALFMLEKIPNRAFDVLGDLTVRGIARMKGIKLDPVFKFKELPAMWRGFKRWAYYKRTGRRIPFKVKKGTKLDVDLPMPFSKKVNDVVGAPVSFLKKGDDIFKEAVGYMEYYARHVMGERGDDLLSAIYEEQLHRTFQDTAGPLAKWLLEGKKRVPGLRWIIPFVKTPERLLMRGLERTPPGAAGKLIRDLVRGGTQKQIAHDIGLLYQSALLTMGVGWLWSNAKVTGDAPDDEAERAAFYESGKKPNSILIGKHWVPFARMEPAGTALSLMVNFTQDVANSDKEMPIDKIADGIGGITQTLANKTYFSGVLGFMRAAAEPQIYGGKLISKFVASGMPGLFKFAADIIDPVYRQPEGLVGEVAKRTPFASKLIEPTLGVFGDVQPKVPLGIGTEKRDPLTLALKDTPVPMPSRRLGGEKLTVKEYNNILRQSGPYLRQLLEAATALPVWQEIPRGIRQKIVDDAARQIRGAYRDVLLMQKIAEDPKKLVDKYLE